MTDFLALKLSILGSEAPQCAFDKLWQEIISSPAPDKRFLFETVEKQSNPLSDDQISFMTFYDYVPQRQDLTQKQLGILLLNGVWRDDISDETIVGLISQNEEAQYPLQVFLDNLEVKLHDRYQKSIEFVRSTGDSRAAALIGCFQGSGLRLDLLELRDGDGFEVLCALYRIGSISEYEFMTRIDKSHWQLMWAAQHCKLPDYDLLKRYPLYYAARPGLTRHEQKLLLEVGGERVVPQIIKNCRNLSQHVVAFVRNGINDSLKLQLFRRNPGMIPEFKEQLIRELSNLQ